jgi:uncharacterized repeat protein (TIGR01451 family)
MKGKFVAFLLALFGVASIGIVQLQAEAASIDNTRDCDRFAVVYCGTMSVAEARNKYDQRDHARVFSSMGIGKSELSGTFRDGVVYQDGRVVVNGRTVATGATMAARGLGGSSISGTTASKVSVSRMGSAQTAMVKFDQNGRFLFAVMKPCGNPVTATPTQPPKPEPKPSAVCKGLSKTKLEKNSYRFEARAAVKNGAKVKSYEFQVNRNGSKVATKTVRTSNLSARYTYRADKPGSYVVKVTVHTSVGAKSSADCVQKFTVDKPEQQKTPAVEVEKFVENLKYKRVGVNVEYDYQINVTNTGNRDLKNVVVTDTPVEGITLVSADQGNVEDNTWTHTIPSLTKGETMSFTLSAKVPEYLAGKLTNTVCVDTPEVPGDKDDCDTADVDVPKPGEEVPPAETPEELPETGPAEAALQMIGAMSLAGSGAYYVASRRGL